MAAYIFKTLTGEFKGLDSDGVAAVFNDMLARPGYMTFWMVLVVLLSFFICSLGLQKGVERITKAMMSCLFLILLILCIRSVTLPGASEGLALLSDSRFYQIYRKRRRQHDLRRNGTGVLYPESRHRCDGDFRQLHR